jgi:phosphomethylpyrimidine synthase
MNVQAKPAAVTTGPIAGSRKAFSSPEARPDIAVPFREIDLHPTANEPPFRVYDTSGPYSDPSVQIDLEAGAPAVRERWIAARGFGAVAPRAIKPEDNGFVPVDKLVAHCPAPHTVRAAAPGQPVTQLEFARRGIITEEMIFVAHARGRRELRRRDPAVRHARVRPRRDRGGARHHPGQHQPPGT